MIENDKINAFVKTIESTIESYSDMIKKSGKAISEPRSNDISSIHAILNSFSSNTVLDRCTFTMKGYVSSIKTGWWFFKSRLKLSLTAAIEPFENPVIAIHFTQNLRLQESLNAALLSIDRLVEMNNDLRRRLDARPAETRPIPVPVPPPAVRSINGEQENDLEVGSLSASDRSYPNDKRENGTKATSAVSMGMWRSK